MARKSRNSIKDVTTGDALSESTLQLITETVEVPEVNIPAANSVIAEEATIVETPKTLPVLPSVGERVVLKVRTLAYFPSVPVRYIRANNEPVKIVSQVKEDAHGYFVEGLSQDNYRVRVYADAYFHSN